MFRHLLSQNTTVRDAHAIVEAMYPRKNKYRSRKVSMGGISFDSKKEARQWGLLVQMQALGRIRDLRRQVTYRLEVNGTLICSYRADFVYFDCEENREVVADAKGMKTPEYKLKKKMMKAIHGIEIKEM